MVSGKTLFWSVVTALGIGTATGYLGPKFLAPTSDIEMVLHKPKTGEIFVSEVARVPFGFGEAAVKSTFKPDSAPPLDYGIVKRLNDQGWTIYRQDSVEVTPLR